MTIWIKLTDHIWMGFDRIIESSKKNIKKRKNRERKKENHNKIKIQKWLYYHACNEKQTHPFEPPTKIISVRKVIL